MPISFSGVPDRSPCRFRTSGRVRTLDSSKLDRIRRSEHTMTVDLTVAQLEELNARVHLAERAVANLECALESNRRIGMAIGILMCQRQLTDDQAFAILRTQSQRRHVKVRDLAESVIFTGTL
jgi:AmiR/NasT family two-component response regulator